MPVSPFNGELDGFCQHGGERLCQIQARRQRACPCSVMMNSQTVQAVLKGRDGAEDAYRSSDGGGGSPYLVSLGGNPVTTGGSDGAHGDDIGFTVFFQLQEFLADGLGSKDRSAPGIYPQDHGLYLTVRSGLPDQGCQRVAADGAGGLVPVKDGTLRYDDADFILAAAFRGGERLQVVPVRDLPVVRRCVGRGHFNKVIPQLSMGF